MAGPPTAASTTTSTVAVHDRERPELPFGTSLIAWDENDLIVGYPGYLYTIDGMEFRADYGGVIYRITDPL